MGISFVASAIDSQPNGADTTITLPTGSMAVDDLILVAYAIGDNDNIDFTMAMVTAGYTLVPNTDLFSNDTQDTNLGVFYKFWNGTDTTAVSDGQGGTDAAVAAVAMIFRGVDTTTPIDVAAVVATGLNTMHPDPPAVTWSTSGAWVVAVGASGHTLGGSPGSTYTFPTGYTTNARARAHDDTSDVTVGVGYNSSPAATENPGVFTHSGTDSASFSWAAATIALRPASVVDADAEISWSELEVPALANADAEISWTEFEAPNAPAAAQVSWIELEVPVAPADAEVAWTELEVPTPGPANADAEISWTEIEVATANADAEVAWVEVEVPNVGLVDADAEIAWVEIQVPPLADAGAELAWTEVQVPSLTGEPSDVEVIAAYIVDPETVCKNWNHSHYPHYPERSDETDRFYEPIR